MHNRMGVAMDHWELEQFYRAAVASLSVRWVQPAEAWAKLCRSGRPGDAAFDDHVPGSAIVNFPRPGSYAIKNLALVLQVSASLPALTCQPLQATGSRGNEPRTSPASTPVLVRAPSIHARTVS